MHLYIHIPFCKTKCSYCDFVSGAYSEAIQNQYIDALILELRQIFEQIQPQSIKTVYIGGGTPSALSGTNLEKLFRALAPISLQKLQEFTMECNPESVDEELILLMKKHAVQRVSMGVQSANNDELRFLNRIHDFECVKNAMNLLRTHNIQNISLDLIFNLPGQTMDTLQNSLNEFLALNPEHISCYSLIIEPNTPMMKLLEDGIISEASDEDYIRQYRFITQFLEKKGYHQYEISNYAKKNHEAIHNTAYWIGNDYIGAGISAHSKQGNIRYANISDIKEYILRMNAEIQSTADTLSNPTHSRSAACESTENDASSNHRSHNVSDRVPKISLQQFTDATDLDSIEYLSEKDQLNELFFLGLRQNIGITFGQIKEKLEKLNPSDQKDAELKINESTKKLLSQKLIQKQGESISLTQKGREISNTVFIELMI